MLRFASKRFILIHFDSATPVHLGGVSRPSRHCRRVITHPIFSAPIGGAAADFRVPLATDSNL
jgi:hypothetical protein